MWLKLAMKHIGDESEGLNALDMWHSLFNGTMFEDYVRKISRRQFQRIRDIYQTWSLVLRLLNPENRFMAFMLLLRTSPNHHWRSSSSTGKYHPVDDHGPGGQMNHELKVVAQALEVAKLLGVQKGSEDYQSLIMSAVLHDHAKYGIPSEFSKEELPEDLRERVNEDHGALHTTQTHDIDMAKLIRHEGKRIVDSIADNDPEVADKLSRVLDNTAKAVEWHSGPWRSDLSAEEKLRGPAKVNATCWKCEEQLPPPETTSEWMKCPHCGAGRNRAYDRPTEDQIADYQAGMLPGIPGMLHMSDYIASRYYDKAPFGVGYKDMRGIEKVIPNLKNRENYIRSVEEAVKRIKHDLEN